VPIRLDGLYKFDPFNLNTELGKLFVPLLCFSQKPRTSLVIALFPHLSKQGRTSFPPSVEPNSNSENRFVPIVLPSHAASESLFEVWVVIISVPGTCRIYGIFSRASPTFIEDSRYRAFRKTELISLFEKTSTQALTRKSGIDED
jgi:hypothetical protein